MKKIKKNNTINIQSIEIPFEDIAIDDLLIGEEKDTIDSWTRLADSIESDWITFEEIKA